MVMQMDELLMSEQRDGDGSAAGRLCSEEDGVMEPDPEGRRGGVSKEGCGYINANNETLILI